jgi:hypothetical protein
MALDLSTDPLYKTLENAGENKINTVYGQQQMNIETGVAGRGLSRSGMGLQLEGMNNAQKASDMANMQARTTNTVMQYRQNQETLALEQAQLKYQKKKQRHSWLGTALGVVGAVVGTFICPGIGTMLGGMLGAMAGQAASGGSGTGGFMGIGG